MMKLTQAALCVLSMTALASVDAQQSHQQQHGIPSFTQAAADKAATDDEESLRGRNRKLQGGPPPISPQIGSLGALIPILDKEIATHETPIAVRLTSFYSALFWNCIAAFSTDHKDMLTSERPVIIVPDTAAHTDDNRFKCAAQTTISYSSLTAPGPVEELAASLAATGMVLEKSLPAEVAACATNDVGCLKEIAADSNYDAAMMGHVLSRLAYDFSLSDGWNELGMDDGCVVNCRRFRDTTGYAPVTRSMSTADPASSKSSKSSKSTPGDPNQERWQPLTEDNGKGFFVMQEHVTPHIGQKAKFRFLPESDRTERNAPEPTYSLNRYVEAFEVIERMAALDDRSKIEVEVFDNKQLIGGTVLNNFIGKLLSSPDFVDTELGIDGLVISYERFVHFATGFVVAEFDAVVIAWKEKVKFDLIRPTTLIKRADFPQEMITTWYAGVGNGPLMPFRNDDFEAYIRVMPHSEYVSGSACIFQSIGEFVDGYMEKLGLADPTFPVVFAPIDTSVVEPGLVPSQPVQLSYATMSEMVLAGSLSRFNGGMHFRESVPAALELCSGIGYADLEGMFNLI